MVTLFGDNLRRIFGTSNDALTGEQDKETGAKKTRKNLIKSKEITTFNKDNKPEQPIVMATAKGSPLEKIWRIELCA